MIAVLTWKLHNFGTALQAYALVSFISQHNKQNGGCRLLNYSLPGRDKIVRVEKLTFVDLMYKLKNRLAVWKKDKRNQKARIFYAKEVYEQNHKFQEFYKEIPHDDHLVDKKEKIYFNNIYEKVIVGSDQVWNPKYFCEAYFLDFVDDEKKYSYAPSLGVSRLTSNEEEFLRSKLEKHFQRISIRENTGKRLIENILKKDNVVCALDPTLLFTGNQWSEIFNLESNIDEKYILIYTLADKKWYKNAIFKIANETGINNIIYLTSEDNLYFYSDQKKLITNAGPIEFLKLIKNAEFVVTDSFHGICFSLNFEKQFICLSRFDANNKKHENSRVVDLLKQLDICDKVYFSDSKISINILNYTEINQKLNSFRQQSQNYLLEIIKEKGNC